MNRFFLHQEFCGDGSSRFTGRVGSIIHEFRPALRLTRDLVAPDLPAPNGFEADFDTLKGHILRAAAATAKIQLAGEGRVLATCFRVGDNPFIVATARHVARAILHENAWVGPGPNPEIGPAGEVNLRDLDVVFEETDLLGPQVCKIAGFEFTHPSSDIALLRLSRAPGRDPLPLATALTGDAAKAARVCVVGYPVTRPGPSGRALFTSTFGGDANADTGVKRASPGMLKSVAFPPAALPLTARHDATTLPGSSGSPVIEVTTGALIGLHYQGDAGVGRNMMVYLPGVLTDGAVRDRFDPDVSENAVTPFPPAPPPADPPVKAEIGRALDLRSTADEMFEAVRTAGPASAAPGTYSNSPRTLADRRDIRDRYYQPSLRVPDTRRLPDPVPDDDIREQWRLADCCGCAIATAIERGLAAQGRPGHVSTRMLYEMGRLHDEFVDDLPEGTSLRGAIKGLFHNGVASVLDENDKAADLERDWFLSIARAKRARDTTLGAYYRLRPNLPDFQMAIQEAGAVVVSAWTHGGWRAPKAGVIERRHDRRAPHAFVLVGYDETGFLLQNSWGKDWGGWRHPETRESLSGVAHWSYADWADTVMDAWVLQIAPSAPTAHNLPLRAYKSPDEPRRSEMPGPISALPEPRRLALIGHITHAERLGLIEDGRIGAGLRSIRETALHLGTSACWRSPEKRYTGLAFIFHDPTLGPESAARLSAMLIPRFKAARIYPMNILYGTDEIRSLVARMSDEARFASALGSANPQDITAYLERRAVRVAEPLLAAFLDGCEEAAAEGNTLWSILANFGIESVFPPDGRTDTPRPIHVVGFGVGSVAAQACLGTRCADWVMKQTDTVPLNPASVSLLAPIGIEGHAITAPEGWQPDPTAPAPKPFVAKLGPTRAPHSILDGYRGEWTDLLAAIGRRIENASREDDRRSRQPGTIADLLTDPDTLNRMMKVVTTKSRLPNWASFSPT